MLMACLYSTETFGTTFGYLQQEYQKMATTLTGNALVPPLTLVQVHLHSWATVTSVSLALLELSIPIVVP